MTQGYYHPKIIWFQGVGAYIGSANLTEGGYQSNVECGVWFTEEELARDNFDTELGAMMASIRERCVSISKEHVAARERLLVARKLLLDGPENEYRRRVATELAALPGATSPLRGLEGTAKAAFVREWHEALTFLRGFAERARAATWPTWIQRSVEPSIAPDPRFQRWFGTHGTFGASENVQSSSELFYERNRRDPGAATDRLLVEWAQSQEADLDPDFAQSANDQPRSLQT